MLWGANTLGRCQTRVGMWACPVMASLGVPMMFGWVAVVLAPITTKPVIVNEARWLMLSAWRACCLSAVAHHLPVVCEQDAGFQQLQQAAGWGAPVPQHGGGSNQEGQAMDTGAESSKCCEGACTSHVASCRRWLHSCGAWLLRMQTATWFSRSADV